LTENVFYRDFNVAEEQFIEFGAASHLTQRANFHAGRFQVFFDAADSRRRLS
jgi:hypothetical protein